MKILNWVFGSFFRTMGRFLFYLAIGVAIAFLFNGAFISNVSAMSNLNDFSDLVIDEGGTFYSINSNTSATAGGYNIMELTGTSNGLKYNVAFPTASFNYGTYGGHLVQCNLGLTEGSYYSITYFFQNESGYNAYLHPFYTSRTYKLGIYNNVNNYSTSFNAEAISDGVQNYPSMYGGYVGSFTLIFKAPITGTCLGTTFSTNSASPANNASYFGFLGYKLENLGSKPLSSADIQNAMTQSLTSVENKLNNLNNQQQQTNNKLDNLNDKITSEDSPKLDGLNNSAGWLPPGPVDSILNLPLSLLENITDNLGKSCQPINVNLPYVNETLTLPCISSIYSQIEGLSTWVNFVGTIASAFILLSYFIKLYKWVDDTLTFRENNHLDNWGGL